MYPAPQIATTFDKDGMLGFYHEAPQRPFINKGERKRQNRLKILEAEAGVNQPLTQAKPKTQAAKAPAQKPQTGNRKAQAAP